MDDTIERKKPGINICFRLKCVYGTPIGTITTLLTVLFLQVMTSNDDNLMSQVLFMP